MLRYVLSAINVREKLSLFIAIRRFIKVNNLKKLTRYLSSYILRYSKKDFDNLSTTSIR